MRNALFAAILALAASAASADYTASNGRDSVRLTDKPCAGEVAALLGEQAKALGAGVAYIGGTQYEVCWMPRRDAPVVQLFFPDGDQGMVPFADFHKSPEI